MTALTRLCAEFSTKARRNQDPQTSPGWAFIRPNFGIDPLMVQRTEQDQPPRTPILEQERSDRMPVRYRHIPIGPVLKG